MRAEVVTDKTRRTIDIEVHDVPDIDVTRPYHRKPRKIRPDLVTIIQINGGLSQVDISGALVLKSGETSDLTRDSKTWYRGDVHRHPDTMPDWAKTLVNQAPSGVTTWSGPDE